ncbi:hypothetical protein [Streptomyces werraensis]|uniref:hypothetical protein n=1 Tax=Streptomyces werraensis TaxID=68284 RepID=UPI001CE2EC54
MQPEQGVTRNHIEIFAQGVRPTGARPILFAGSSAPPGASAYGALAGVLEEFVDLFRARRRARNRPGSGPFPYAMDDYFG